MYMYIESGIYIIIFEVCNVLGCDVVMLVSFLEVDFGCFFQNILQYGNEIIMVCFGNFYDLGGFDVFYLEGSFGSVIIVLLGVIFVSIIFSLFNYQEYVDFVFVYDGLFNGGVFIGIFIGIEFVG